MDVFNISGISIKGVAAAVPKTVFSNENYDLLTEKEKRLLMKTTGVEQKRVAKKGVTTSDYCLMSAEQLMGELNWEKDEIGVLVFLSQSRDYYLPATSIILQDKMGLPKSCIAFDVSLGCSGYVYGLSIIASMMKSVGRKKGLLLVGDISSATCSYEDKSTYPLFGDAGTATALELEDTSEGFHFNLMNDGKDHDAIIIPHGGIRNRATRESFDVFEAGEGIKRHNLDLSLDGLRVFNFSVTDVPPAVRELMEARHKSPADYDHFVMHQANKLMNETIRRKLKFEPEQVPYSLQQFGNTSSASIPLTMVTQLREALTTKTLNLLLSGFGVGLSWGVVELSTSSIVCPPIIESD